MDVLEAPEGFEELDEEFKIIDAENSNDDVFDPIDEEEKPKKKRGRKPGTKIKKKEESEEPEEKPKKTTVKKTKDEDPENVSPEVILTVLNKYSKEPLKDIIKETGLSEKCIQGIIDGMGEIFNSALEMGDIEQEDLDKIITPMLTKCSEKKSNLQIAAEKITSKIKNTKKTKK